MRSVSLKTSILVLLATTSVATSAAPNAPELAVGDSFRFEASAPPAPPKRTGEGPLTIPPPRPVAQTVSVVDEVTCGTARCLVLEAEQELPSFGLPGENATNVAEIRARVEKDSGRLVEIESVMRVAGQELRTSTPVTGRNSLFADFYGPWMVDLHAGWAEEFALPGKRTRRYAVTGQETVQGRPCFVVRRTTPRQDGSIETTNYWIDRQRRIAVQVQQDDWRLVLAETRAAAEAKGVKD